MSRAQYDVSLLENLSEFILRKKDMEFSVNLIQQGQKDGSIREGNPIALTTAFFMAIQGIAENIAQNPE